MLYNDKFLFIHIPKTGGTSIKQALGQYCSKQFVVAKEERLSSFGKYKLHQKMDEQILRDHKSKVKFCSVRNPWSWYASYWRFSKKYQINKEIKNQTWNQFVDYFVTPDNTQFSYITVNNEIVVDRFLNFHTLVEDFNILCQDLNISAELDHYNYNGKFDYRSLYNGEQAEKVQDICKQEIEYFNWKF